MAKQGKCENCRIRWYWAKEGFVRKLSNIVCPECHGELKPTTTYLKWESREITCQQLVINRMHTMMRHESSSIKT